MAKFIAKTLATVTAWKYQPDIDIPVWVARKCHHLGDGKFTGNTIVGPVPIDVGDYVVLVDLDGSAPGSNAITVVNGAEFDEEYRPIGDSARRVATFGHYAVFSPYESCDGASGWTVQRMDSGDGADPDEFGEQIAEFYDRFDAELFAEAKAESDDDARRDHEDAEAVEDF